MVYLAPVLPAMTQAASRFLGAPLERWAEIEQPLLGSPLQAYVPLATRLEAASVAKLIEPTTTPAAATAPSATPPLTSAHPPAATQTKPLISIEDFAKLDLRIARVIEATDVAGSDKLLCLRLDLGGVERTVFSGIRRSYQAKDLVGRDVVVVANLAPRKMRFGTSEGMVLCATDAEDQVFLLGVESGAPPGAPVS